MISSTKRVVILIIILLAGLSLRVYGINYSLPTQERMNYYFSEGVEKAPPDKLYVTGMLGTAHPDEVDMLGVISNMNPSKLDFNPHFFYYGGCLHFFTMALFLKIASLFNLFILTPIKEFYFLNPGEYARMYLVGKTMVIIFAILSIFMAYLLGKSLYGKKTGILSALFIAIFPWHVLLSHFMIPDVPVTFWATLTIYCCINLIRTNKLKWYVLTGAAYGLAGATKYNGLLLVFPIITAHLLSKPQDFKNYLLWLFDKKLIICFITAALFTFIVGNPYMIVSFGETMEGIFRLAPNTSYCRHFPPTIMGFFYNIARNLFGRSLIYLSVGLNPLLLFLFAGGMAYAFYRRNKSDILLLGWIFPYYLIVSATQWSSATHLMPIIPCAIILISRLIVEPLGSVKIGKYQGLFTLPLVLVISFYGLFGSLKYGSLMTQKDTRMEAAGWIRQNIPAGSAVGLPNDSRKDEYCVAPPLDMSKYKLKVIGYEPGASDLSGIDYVILTGILQMELLPEVTKKFHELKEFKRFPNILGFSLNRRQSSDFFIRNLMQSHKRIYRNSDWVQPDIKIFKRSE